MTTTSSASSPLNSSPPLLPPISSSDDNGSLADSIAIQSSFTDSLAHNPPAYPIDLDENSDNDADIEPDAGSPTLPPGLGGFRASVGGAEQISEEIETPTRTLVPIPTVSPEAGTISFAFPNTNDSVTNDLSALSRPLPPESGADIVIAPDKSYVETSSAPWAMELKRRYDTLYGVNVIVRSPYAITAFVGQHGQKRYRIGHRELSAPGASGVVAEDLLVSKHSKSPPPQTSPQSSKTGIAVGGGRSKSNSIKSPPGSIAKTASKLSLAGTETPYRSSHQSQSYSRASKSSKNGKRHSRGRISINALLGSGSGPTVPGPSGISVASTPRKLRKPRSNPDLSLSSPNGDIGHGYPGYGHTYGYGQHPPSSFYYNNSTGATGFSGRMHSLSVTATDMPHVLGIDPSNLSSIPASSLFTNPTHLAVPTTKTRKGDSFGEVMGWRTPLASPSSTSSLSNGFTTSAPSTSYATHNTHNSFFDLDSENRSAHTNVASYPSATSSTNNSASEPNFIPRPFGPGVHFETPAILHRHTHDRGRHSTRMNGSSGPSSTSRSRSGSGSVDSGSGSELEHEPEDLDSEPDTDYGNFLRVQHSTRAQRHLREMQSFESGLTATPMPPITPTAPGKFGGSSSDSPRATSSNTRRLEVDLGGDINLNLGEIVNIVDKALIENAGQKVVERQRSAIRLVDHDREREREKAIRAASLETIEADTTSSFEESNPNLHSDSLQAPTPHHPVLAAPLTQLNGETSAFSSTSIHDASSGDSPNGNSESQKQPELSASQQPRVQLYSPSGLPPRLAKFTTYSTEIFDVLQTSRGLPRLDLLDVVTGEDETNGAVQAHDDSSPARHSPLPETIPVKLSLSQDGSAAPKDDPRFVIWGEVVSSEGGNGGDASSVSHESSASNSSSIGIRLGTKGKGRVSDVQSNGIHGTANAKLGSDDGSEKPRVLLAATIERWLAQLTSDLDYDELLNFFLTYRTYVSALDLARLLMTRFCWALGSNSSGSSSPHPNTSSISSTPFSPPNTASTSSTATVRPDGSSMTALHSSNTVNHDDVVRRIVRVRTFVAFKYWLITFFTVDFVPNRELRLFVANNWNDLAKELQALGKEVDLAGKEMGQEGREFKERELGMSRGAIVDGMSIVKKLKNVAKDCKKLYTHNNSTATSNHPAHNSASQPPSTTANTGSDVYKSGKENLFGEKFAEATRKLSAASAHSTIDTDDSDVDLDFIDEPSSSPYSGVYGQTPANNVHLGGASTLNLSTAISPPGPGSIPLSSFSILQRTDHAPGPDIFANSIYNSSLNTTATPIAHNALSRVLVKTLGRLGRWKRVLNSGGVAHGVNMHRSMTTGGLGKPHSGGGLTRMATACADVSAFDVELTVDSSDLLTSSGGVESYLKLVEGSTSQVPHNQPQTSSLVKISPSVPAAAATSSVVNVDPSTPTPTPPRTPNRHSFAESFAESLDETPSSSSSQVALDASTESSDQISLPSSTQRLRDSVAESVSDYGAVINVRNVHDSVTPSSGPDEEISNAPHNRESRVTRRSSRTSSTGSFGEPLSANRASARFPAFTSPWQFDVASLDDLSDNSSDEPDATNHRDDAPAAPPGLRRPPRRLPLRREFEFLERPETVSSMGIISRSSIVSASSASGQSTASHASSSSAAGGLGAGIQQWQMNALKDSLMDDEEPGDVEDALKRLEGQINPEKQMEKASKVNGWVKTIRERLAAGDYSDEEPMYSDDEDDIEHEGRSEFKGTSQNTQDSESTSDATPSSPEASLPDAESGNVRTPVMEQTTSPVRTTDAKPAVEDAVPLEIRQSRLSSEAPVVISPVISKFVDPSSRPKATVHRSFVVLFKVEDLAQHFAMIDRELFMTIKFEELLLEEWMFCEEVDTLDWAQFLKDRARWKVESRWPEKTSALGAVRARFNLMVNFTVSEIVLTNPTERSYVFSRFLRIAWKSYQRNSFNTLVAIMTGLQSPWVSKAMRKSMHKLTVWDNRMLTDLRLFTSRKDNFKHIRSAVDAINDLKPPEASAHAPSVGSATGSVIDQTPPACIPFMGTYLSQLHQYNQLPPLIDPTAPNEVVTYDPVSSNLSSPAHPHVFSTLASLPSSMHLEPLINVHRQRLIAAVIKSLVAGQHLASRVQFPIDKKLFHKCLRIRGLDSDTLQRALGH